MYVQGSIEIFGYLSLLLIKIILQFLHFLLLPSTCKPSHITSILQELRDSSRGLKKYFTSIILSKSVPRRSKF